MLAIPFCWSCNNLRFAAVDIERFYGALLVEWLRQQTKLPHLSEANPQVFVETPLHPENRLFGALYGLVESLELWFQQDGATCYTARATIDLLKDTFGDRLISRFGPVNWPPRSCDLTPLDSFLWGYVKSLVYADKPQTLDHLEDNIRRVIADIRPQMLEKVIENWTSSLDYIRASCSSHMP
ncbi:putative transposable element [Trichonephila clavipes]|nr:putative transposable element [Trichonephila clavipes]